jgi:CheY-like chemotaxis protein
MNGHELLEAVRGSPGISETPFIMVTAHVEPKSVISARQAGANSYIGIPFTITTLKSKIMQTLDP